MINYRDTSPAFSNQRGIALITVMLVLALIVIIAAGMTSRLQLLMNRSINQQAYQQGMWAALSGEQLVYKVLEQDYKDNKKVTHLKQFWASEGLAFPIGDGMLSGKVQDLHSCFNVNALAVKPAQPGGKNPQRDKFEILLLSVGLESYVAELLTSTIGDWVDDDRQMSGSLGAEDENYASKVVPYLAANSSMLTITELMAVEGVTAAIYRKIRPLLCVLPALNQRININTISADNAHILVAMFDQKLDLSNAQAIIAARPEEGFTNVADFFALPEVKAAGTLSAEDKKQFELRSDDFRAQLTFSVQDRSFTVESIYQRNAKHELVVVSRQFGKIE